MLSHAVKFFLFNAVFNTFCWDYSLNFTGFCHSAFQTSVCLTLLLTIATLLQRELQPQFHLPLPADFNITSVWTLGVPKSQGCSQCCVVSNHQSSVIHLLQSLNKFLLSILVPHFHKKNKTKKSHNTVTQDQLHTTYWGGSCVGADERWQHISIHLISI